jgi:hypothetical protein
MPPWRVENTPFFNIVNANRRADIERLSALFVGKIGKIMHKQVFSVQVKVSFLRKNLRN